MNSYNADKNKTTEYNTAIRATKIMQETFKNDYDTDVFFNKHFGNPNRVNNPVVIITENTKDAGVGCFLGMKLLVNECVPSSDIDKAEFIVSQNCELCVHPDFQGQGFFHKIIDERDCVDTDEDFIFGLPNEKSFPALIKAGYDNRGNITRYRLFPHKYLSFAKKVFRKLTKNKAVILPVDNAINVKSTANYFTEKEYMEINSTGIRFERSNDIFNWLFTYKNNEYLLKDYDENGVLTSYVIFRQDLCPLGTVIAIDDWYSKDSRPDYFNMILTKLGKYCDMIEIYTVNERADDDFMKKSGLSNIKDSDKSFHDRPYISSKKGKTFTFFDNVSLRNVDDDYFFYE